MLDGVYDFAKQFIRRDQVESAEKREDERRVSRAASRDTGHVLCAIRPRPRRFRSRRTERSAPHAARVAGVRGVVGAVRPLDVRPSCSWRRGGAGVLWVSSKSTKQELAD